MSDTLVSWVADTHVHLYPDYDLGRLFRAAVTNLRALARSPDDRLALFLTERAGTHMYRDLQQGSGSLTVVSESDRLRVEVEGEELVIVPGRQIVTRDRIEILSLGVEEEIPDGGELEEILQHVRDVGGIPVLPWSPGKWMGARGAKILDKISHSQPSQLSIGDIYMRARGTKEPAAFRMAREHGLSLLAGTDPLPLPNEEDLVGRFGVRMFGDSPRQALETSEIIGERQGLIAAGARWARQYRRSST